MGRLPKTNSAIIGGLLKSTELNEPQTQDEIMECKNPSEEIIQEN